MALPSRSNEPITGISGIGWAQDKTGHIKHKNKLRKILKKYGKIKFDPKITVSFDKDEKTITVSDNGGEYAEVFKYSNGSLILTAAGSNGFYPFELHPGDYYLNYPAFLNINLSWNYGAGITYNTAFGPFRLEYAIPYIRSNNYQSTLANSDRAKIGVVHASLLYMF